MGVLAPFVSRWFFSKAIEGADRELHARQYNLSLFNLGGHGSNRERLFSKTMVYKQIDALLVLCMALTPDELDHLQKIDIPLVVVGGHVEECAYIGIDDYAASSTAVRHLIDLGHRDIALLHGDAETDLNFDVPRVRIQAFKDVMAAAGLPVRPEWDEWGDFTLRSGQEAFRRLWARPGAKPTAIFCSSDEMAMGIIFEASRAGVRVPEDLSVVGIDDHDFADAMGLTTVRQRPDEQAELATRMLLDELNGVAGAVRSAVAPHQLIVRRTTAAPPS
jgi:DNA-binding LacI/PurR family transcriptional regulator